MAVVVEILLSCVILQDNRCSLKIHGGETASTGIKKLKLHTEVLLAR